MSKLNVQYLELSLQRFNCVGVEYPPRSDMWTILLIFASAMLMAESYQDHDPLHSPHHTTTIVCMVPGPYENGKKRFVQDPMRTVIEEPRLRLPLLPGENPDDCWELPPIEVKQPYLPKDEDELAGCHCL